MTADFCPLLRDKCHGDRCKAWSGGECLVVTFLTQSVASVAQGNATDAGQAADQEIPEELRLASAEDLAGQIAAFAKKKSSGDEISMWELMDGFWEAMGVDEMDLPYDLANKAGRARLLAQQLLNAEKSDLDNAELPSLTVRCVEWARERGLTRLTLSDVDVFMLGANAKLGHDARRKLYATVNVELKTKIGR
jgi:hypothetical protein